MTNAEQIEALQNCANVNYEYRAEGASCSKCPYKEASYCKRAMMLAAADALEAAEKRIAELSLDCELFQQKCMELEAQLQTVTDCHTLEEGER